MVEGTAAPAVPCVEFVDGQRFAWVERTPWLQRLIAHAADAMRERMDGQAATFRIERSEPFVVNDRTTVIPDLLLFVDGRARLVVEYRSESTERYILGPKRLIYGRAGIPDYWFVDPRAAEVLTMSIRGGDDYAWPGRRFGLGDVLVPAAVPGLAMAVDDFTGPVRS